jgi:hypothetical protein
MGNVVDRAMAMKPVKDVEKFKKDSTTGGETNKVVKGVETTSFIAKTVRGLQKMNATGEKVKVVKLKEEQDPITKQIANLGLNKEKWDKMSSNEKLYAVDRNRFIPTGSRIQASKMEFNDLVKMYDGALQGFAFPTKTQSIRPGIGDAIQNKLTKETLIKMIREELDEITGAYGGDAMSAEDGSSYINK